jgi:signal transduction histidine kinase
VRAHEKGLYLSCEIAPNVPADLVGDPTRLRQVLLNLLGNAIKFTESGHGLAAVDADPDARFQPRCGSVSDTGIGIPADKLARIFERFTQADSSTTRRFGGSGLGLTISKRLVELMGGRIGVERPSARAASSPSRCRSRSGSPPTGRSAPPLARDPSRRPAARCAS